MNQLAVVGSGAGVTRIRLAAADAVEVIAVTRLDDVPEGIPAVLVGDPGGVASDPRIAHVVRPNLHPTQLCELVESIAEGHVRAAPPPRPPETPQEARMLQAALAASRRLAGAVDLVASENIGSEAIADLVDADRVYLLFHDADDGSLWSEAKLKKGGDDRRAIAGVAGFAARTGLPVVLERAGTDARWYKPIDDPSGDAQSRLMVQPVCDAEGQVNAVIVAARDGRRPPFTEPQATVLAHFAGFAQPFLDQMSIHIQAQAMLDDGEPQLFRQEAVEALAAPRWGDVVRVSPAWISWSYWLLVLLLLASGTYLWIGRIATYSAGHAVIRSTTRTDITARIAGNVSSVEVAAGDHVKAGELIVRLDDANQGATVERDAKEFQTQLRNHMLDLADASAEASVRGAHLALEAARTELEDRVVRAPAAGVIDDIRVRAGQHVEPGDLIATVVDGAADLEVIALLPGSDRPQLAVGMPLRLELEGYRYTYQTLVIESVSQDVVSPSEARRVLGDASFPVDGPVVIVHAHIPSSDFVVDGKTYRYHDGMPGQAEVRVREERLLYTLIPGARRIGE